MKPDITVYVRSAKVLVGEKLVEELYPVKRTTRAYEYSRDTVFEVKHKKEYDFVLLDDQKELVKSLTRLAEKHGLRLKIIDVAKATVIFGLWKNLRGIKSFPTVETKHGRRLKSPFS
jgi:hypothetical protein